MNITRIFDEYYPAGSTARYFLEEHSRAVSVKALAIARNSGLPGLDMEFIHEAAMLHDIGICFCKAENIGCFGSEPYISHGHLGAELMCRLGYPRHALVCERHFACGISREEIIRERLPFPHRDMVPVSFEEKIICLADKFYSKTEQWLTTEKPLPHVWENMRDQARPQFLKLCEELNYPLGDLVYNT